MDSNTRIAEYKACQGKSYRLWKRVTTNATNPVWYRVEQTWGPGANRGVIFEADTQEVAEQFLSKELLAKRVQTY